MMDPKPTRYAFIDVQNTEGTVGHLLGFVIDWHKLYLYLKEQWNCEKIFFYSGIEVGNEIKTNEYLELEKLGYGMHVKPYSVYVVSSARKIKVAERYSVSRFSTKLRKLIAEKSELVFFKDINDWKMKIRKEI